MYNSVVEGVDDRVARTPCQIVTFTYRMDACEGRRVAAATGWTVVAQRMQELLAAAKLISGSRASSGVVTLARNHRCLAGVAGRRQAKTEARDPPAERAALA